MKDPISSDTLWENSHGNVRILVQILTPKKQELRICFAKNNLYLQFCPP